MPDAAEGDEGLHNVIHRLELGWAPSPPCGSPASGLGSCLAFGSRALRLLAVQLALVLDSWPLDSLHILGRQAGPLAQIWIIPLFGPF